MRIVLTALAQTNDVNTMILKTILTWDSKSQTMLFAIRIDVTILKELSQTQLFTR